MDYRIWILEKLIQKYENSKLFTDKGSIRKVSIRLQDEEALNKHMERVEEKEEFLSALTNLEQDGLINFSWVRYETGNLVDRIWLIADEDKIKECYQLLGRIPKGNIIDSLHQLLITYLEKVVDDGEIRLFLKEQEKYIRQRRKIPRFFTEDMAFNEDILKCLMYLAGNSSEIQERILSSHLYGDSKYFERFVKGKLVSILRVIKKEKGEEFVEEECLREKGLVKWPEVLEFTGNVKIRLEDGSCIDYGLEVYGAYINSITVEKVEDASLFGVSRVLFIENKANYVWYVSKKRMKNELVIYHGGFYSPTKGKWFEKLYEAGKKCLDEIKYYHWSDIDVGGFRIFNRLKESIVLELLPYKMDIESLEKNRDKGMLMEEPYRKILKEMGEDTRYAIFSNLIHRMLELNIRLEQEQLLY